MDRLLDSFKVTHSQTYMIMYYIIVASIVAIILGILWLIYFIKTGFSLKGLLAGTPSLPNIATNSIIFFIAGMIFISILFILVRSQWSDATTTLPTDNQGKIPVNKTFWNPFTADNPIDPRNLRVNQEEWQPKNCNAMTLGVEIVIFNSRAPSASSPYRHLLHRGSEDLVLFAPNTPGSSPIGAGGLADGLPSEMAPGIFIDRFTNDLIIYVDTDPVDPIYSNVNHSFRESIRVNDLPLNIPFYLHLTLNGKVLEVYVNCRLAGTKLLHGMPRGMPNEWYGRSGFATSQAIVQNLTLWDGALNTFDLMKLCGKKIKVKKETWELVLSGALPILNLSKCGEVSIGSETISGSISLEHV